MPKQLLLLVFLLPLVCFSQTKVVTIPPSKDTARIIFTTNTVTTTEYKIDYLPSGPGNKAPVASAGNDISITLPVNTVTLSAIASSDADGSISSYAWSKVSGPAANLNQANTALNASGLVQGVYVFKVTVTDNGGLVDDDEVTVVVNPAVSTPGTRANIIYEDMFESSDPKAKYAAQQQWCCSYSVTSSTSIVGEGSRSVRMEHKGTENISGGYRVEFQSNQHFKPAVDLWYGYKMYFENFKALSVNSHIPQWHPTVSGGSAALGIYVGSNTFHVRLNPEGDESAFTLKNGKQIQNGHWYSFVWHIKWASSGGRVELWIDGEKYVDYTGATLTRGGLPYFKLGLNRFASSNTPMIFYVDALRIGNEKSTFSDVNP